MGNTHDLLELLKVMGFTHRYFYPLGDVFEWVLPVFLWLQNYAMGKD